MDPSTSAQSHSLEIIDVIEETADAVSLVFAHPGGKGFDYRPGQFLTLRVPGTPEDGTTWAPRCYSLSSAPGIDAHLQVTVKRTAGGYASNWLCDNAKPGMIIESLPPGGRFTVRDSPDALVLFAAGSGITPVISILRSTLAESAVPVVLVYANRDRGSVVFDAALAELAASHGDRLRITHWLESERGLPDAAALGALLPAPTAATSAFLCGPAPFMDCATEAAAAAGIDGARIHREAFSSLTGDPFAAPVGAPAGGPSSPDGAATVTVDLNGATTVLAWPRETVLLDVLLDQGLDAPYVCREGNCGGCAFTLRRGDVHMLVNDTLDDHELGNGVRLACQSLARADELAVEFD
ncbi:ferredoxin--NADP reductase [Tsukamurella ocularis]|uniref:ferredoxin--NADP reductase n=1 Tax=Tsukamurella ocularis TaxID=1970234 RepID=UPI00216A6BA7|nr:ferredoxin--NADP reductase [Tsukamurella ocularis]MCS3778572.1 3-ketosteroid 9alpha-monooxygenase subunit B [Tsukamurella ocularis]MCS3789273.1 3-ketosteroid 9alpha-monooxygenase subunit B [Tsukamurella ocularis]MCS3853123.1 3-ketosteroid 9alpha-monooxygenase subunit B [Tsukamurella ocularis]